MLIAQQLAKFHGGPLNGEGRAIPAGPEVYVVAKPCLMSAANYQQASGPVTADIGYGRYRLVGHVPDGSVFEWQGWDDEGARDAEPAEILINNRVVQFAACSTDGVRYYSTRVWQWQWQVDRDASEIDIDGEWCPDAMRWTPDVADAEIEEWQKILHPGR